MGAGVTGSVAGAGVVVPPEIESGVAPTVGATGEGLSGAGWATAGAVGDAGAVGVAGIVGAVAVGAAGGVAVGVAGAVVGAAGVVTTGAAGRRRPPRVAAASFFS